MNFKIESALATKEKSSNLKNTQSNIYICPKSEFKSLKKTLEKQLPAWSVKNLEEKTQFLTGQTGPVVIVVLGASTHKAHDNLLNESDYSNARETLGKVAREISLLKSKDVIFNFMNCSDDMITGSLVGLELGLYDFEKSYKLGKTAFTCNGKKVASKLIKNAAEIAVGINQARHLVNLPPNILHPVSYAKEVKKMYAQSKTIKVAIYDQKRLQKEKCGLLLGVGNSAENPPQIVHIKYRPTGAKGKSTALVGKGLTFDSGGLDIKPAAGMRLMKKDMGGSATIVGLSRWLENSGVKKNIDLYLALAENAISERSTRPSDILTARNGATVEIHNTDAEGRLALADAIDMALDLKPEVLIDVATLTGAGKISLGQDIGSLFANDDKLAEKLVLSSQQMGDLMWRMPLYNPYFQAMKSDFADMTNAASTGFGGSITAALFLEKFVGKTKWAHLDIFGWTSGAKPSLVQKGGSGQGVETLIGYFK